MKISKIAALVLVSSTIVGCSEIPTRDTLPEPELSYANKNAFEVLTAAEIAERDFYNMAREQLTDYYAPVVPVERNLDNSDELRAYYTTPAVTQAYTHHADSELNHHLAAIVADVTYVGEAGYWFTLEQNLGEGNTVTIVNQVIVKHDQITDHNAVYNCIGGYVSKCEL